MRTGLSLGLAGSLAGLAGAFGLSRFLKSYLYGVSATDPLTFAAAVLLIVSAAAAASWIPSRKAGRLDPVRILRED